MSTLKTNKVQSVTTSDLTLDTAATSRRIVVPTTTGDDVDLDAASGRLVVGSTSGDHLALDENEIQNKSNATTAGTLNIQSDGGEVQVFGNTAGKMGIGTAFPKNTVQIDHTGADGNDGLLIVRADTSTADTNLLGGIGFDSTDGNVPSSITEASAFIAAYAAESHGTGDKGGDLVFGTTTINDDDDTTSHEWMRITDAGDVGIGTNDPKVPLDVYEMGGLILGYTMLDNDGGATYGSYTVTTSLVVPSANWKIIFKASKSGKVEIQFRGLVHVSVAGCYVFLGLSDNSTYNAVNVKYENEVGWFAAGASIVSNSWYLTGLTAGTTYTYYIGTGRTGGAAAWLFGGTNASQAPPIIIKAISVPNTVVTDAS
jgi:hypothetical protein